MKVILSLPLVVCLAVAAMGQQAPPAKWAVAPLRRVVSIEQLQANTPAERAAAERLHGNGPLRPGNWSIERGQMVSVWAPSTGAEQLEREVCQARAIVTGHSIASHVIVDSRQTTLIMADRLKVSAWVKPRNGPTELEVFTLGGEVNVGETRYAMAYDGEGSWLLDGQPMLLFLERLDPGAYLNRSREMSIPITDGRVKLGGADSAIDDVLEKLRAISAKCA